MNCRHCGKTKRQHFKGGFCDRESHFGEHELTRKFEPADPEAGAEVKSHLGSKPARYNDPPHGQACGCRDCTGEYS